MQDAGLIPKTTTARVGLTFPAKLSRNSDAAGYTVERLFNLRNVNALPHGQEITFGPQLTVIYGPNASGKTGYTRPIGCAAFARGDREVLTDARKASSNLAPQADIEVSKNGAKRTITWINGSRCAELAAVYVFDGTSVNAHLTRPNNLRFSPSGLSLLTKLAEVTDAVRERLRAIIAKKSTAHAFGHYFTGDSPVSQLIANLSAKTDLAALSKLALLSRDEDERIREVDQQIAELKSQNIPKRVAALKQEVQDIEKLVMQLEQTALLLGPTVEAEVKGLIAQLELRRQEAERVGTEQFRFEQFSRVGTDVWREFVRAAKALADAESHSSTTYPQEGDSCLLCRQVLSTQAIDLINRLWDFLASDAPARFEAAKLACSKRIGELRLVGVGYFGADAPARRILREEAAENVAAIDAFLQASSSRCSELQSALRTAAVPQFTVAAAPSLTEMRSSIERRLQEISRIENSDPSKQLHELEQALCELRHRQTLGNHLDSIKAWVEDQRWAARAQKAVGSTHHITAKYNELFKSLVTDKYRDVFQATLRRLKRDLKLTIETYGKKGETIRQIVLSPDAFAQKFAIEKILSDSEKCAVALADFLTEVSLDASSNAIVLDDPVSSFDSDSKEAVAQLLAEQALKRQVVVFTHDLTFLHALKVQSKKVSVGVVSHWIRSEDGEPGYVYLDNSPICEGDYKSAKIARDCYAKAKGLPPAEQERALQQGFGALRTSYEAFVIYDLFNEVVKRFEERVSFDRLKEVNLDRYVVNQVVEKLGALSRHIDAHLHSDEFAATKPTPELLLDEITAFENLRKKHKDSKKTTAATDTAKPNAKAAVATTSDRKDAPSTPEQPNSTAVN